MTGIRQTCSDYGHFSRERMSGCFSDLECINKKIILRA